MAETDVLQQLGPNPSRKEILAHWEPENQAFWEKFGKKIANENLYTSTWALVLSFVVWTLWATIAAKLNAIGFNFTDEQIFTLAALPGLVGATGRLFYTYLPGLLGGKTSTLITTALLLLPILGLGNALQDTSTSYDTFVLLVSFIGIAGANFSASMANIGFFFPKAHKGLALGINAGVGNLGVSLIYLTAPAHLPHGAVTPRLEPLQLLRPRRTDGRRHDLRAECLLLLGYPHRTDAGPHLEVHG